MNHKPLADWLGVPVPQLVDQPLWWIERATVALEAEEEVERELEDRRRRAAGG